MSNNLLQNVYLFKDLSSRELEQLNAIAKIDTFSPGDEVFTEGDVAHSLYVIRLGSVRIQHSGKNGRVDVATLGTGSHFGEMAFVDDEKRSATAVAIEKVEMVRLEYEDLHKLLDGNPSMSVKVFKSLAHFLCGRLRMTTTDLSFAREKNLRHF